MTRRTLTLLPFVLLAAACGPATPEAKEPAPAPSASAATSDNMAAKLADEARGSVVIAKVTAEPAAPVAPAKPGPDADGPDGIRRLAVWEGPKAGKAVTTKKAWVIAPNTMGDDKLSFSSVSLRLVSVEKGDGNELVFTDRNVKYAVPAALAWAAEPAKGVKKGSVVRCNFGGNTTVARVDAVDAKGVTCTFRFMEKTRKEKMALEEARVLSGKLEPGAPAFVRFEGDDKRYRAVVVTVDGDDAWVTVDTHFSDGPRAGRAVHKVKAAAVEVIDMSRPLKAGDACLATQFAEAQVCKVAKVLDGGLAYAVTFADGSAAHGELGLDEVAPAPKAAKK
jgi:hypothetical protein